MFTFHVKDPEPYVASDRVCLPFSVFSKLSRSPNNKRFICLHFYWGSKSLAAHCYCLCLAGRWPSFYGFMWSLEKKFIRGLLLFSSFLSSFPILLFLLSFMDKGKHESTFLMRNKISFFTLWVVSMEVEVMIKPLFTSANPHTELLILHIYFVSKCHISGKNWRDKRKYRLFRF